MVILTTMSVTIDIEYFQSWSEIFMEIERQKNLKYFAAIEPGTTTARRPSSNPGSRRTSRQEEFGGNCGEVILRDRLASTPCPSIHKNMANTLQCQPSKHKLREVKSHARINSTPSPVFDAEHDELHHDSRLTDAAQKLSREEMDLLYKDILKPLDMFSVLNEMKKTNERKK